MIKSLFLVLCFSQINGCAIGYPSWKYRCYEVEVQSGVDVPPMPECGKNNRTIAGIDTDDDGVRDDIQRYIASIDINHPFHIRALHQYAKAARTATVESRYQEKAQLNFTKFNLAAGCAWSATLDGPFYQYTEVITALNKNTFKRRFANYKWLSALEVQLIPSLSSKDSCDFDANSYEGERWK